MVINPTQTNIGDIFKGINKMITKEDIEKKLEVVYRQMEHCRYDDWIPKVRERVNILFSDNVELYPEAIRQIDGVLINDRAWENIVNGNEDEFIDEFKNYGEFFHFGVELMKDINAYNEERLKNK
jgi:tRNA A37 threonylcarbamoyladenosine dehydratase